MFGPRKGASDFPDIVRQVLGRVPEARFRLLGTKGRYQTAEEVLACFPQALRPRVEVVPTFEAEALPDLAFDHAEVVAVALQRLRAKLDYSTITFQFLPATFTLSDLQRVYEIILGEAIDKRNFRKWVLALDQIEETGDLRQGPHRPAKLYRMKEPGSVEIIK